MYVGKANKFHKKCDHNQMNLVLVKTDKGLDLSSLLKIVRDFAKKNDNKSFVFSVDKNAIIEIIKDGPAIIF